MNKIGKLTKHVRKGKLGNEIFVKNSKEKGVTAYFEDFPNIVTQGDSVAEAQTSLWNVVYDILKHFTSPKKT